MKKSTKKTLAAVVIILIFGLSTIAFVATGLFGSTPQDQFKPLDSNVVDAPIDPSVETVYIQHQFTFLRFYYTDKDALFDYTAQLPDIMSLPDGQTQLIVNRLKSNQTRADIINLNGDFEVSNVTEGGIYEGLCQNLVYTPTDCLLTNLTTNQNASSSNLTSRP